MLGDEKIPDLDGFYRFSNDEITKINDNLKKTLTEGGNPYLTNQIRIKEKIKFYGF